MYNSDLDNLKPLLRTVSKMDDYRVKVFFHKGVNYWKTRLESIWKEEDSELIYLLRKLFERLYKITGDIDYAYLYAKLTFAVAYEEALYQQMFGDGLFSGCAKMGREAADLLIDAYNRKPCEDTFQHALSGLMHKVQLDSFEFSGMIEPNEANAEGEISTFLKRVPDTYKDRFHISKDWRYLFCDQQNKGEMQ